MSRERNFLVIWPAYFDSQRTRLEGRKVPKELAVESPSIELIFEVCSALGLDPILEKDKRLPRSYWEKTGRVLVRKAKKKNELIIEIAKALLRRSTKVKPK